MKPYVLYIIMCVCLVASCSQEKRAKGKVTAKVQSAPYELLVVADKEWLKTGAGQTLVDVVEAPIDGLPQAEPNFRVTYIYPDAFDGTFKTYANIVKVRIGRKYVEKAGMAMQCDVYAQPQVLLYLEAHDDRSFVEYVEKNRALILEKLNMNEFQRERALLSKHHNKMVTNQVKKLFGVTLHAPKNIDDFKKGENFLWASDSKQEFRQNVCVYTLPMQDMTMERLVEVRDSVMQVNIPGGREDQWMETDPRTVSASMVRFDGKEIFSVRGLWDMKNAAMGGPFVCYVYPDYAHNSLLVAEGFAFAPEEKKRLIVRQLEAALQTVKWEDWK